MFFRLIAFVFLAQLAIPAASAAELPVRRIDALRALIASEKKSVELADKFLQEPLNPAPVSDVTKPEDLAAVSVGIDRGWLLISDHKFRPNEALSMDDALQWRLRAIGLGAAVSAAADREELPPQTFVDAVKTLRDYKWTISPAYNPGEFVSLPDARALFATATGVILPANPVTYPWQEIVAAQLAAERQNMVFGQATSLDSPRIASILTIGDPSMGSTVAIVPNNGTSSASDPTVVVDESNSWWPFPSIRVAVIDGMIQRTLGLVSEPAGAEQALPQEGGVTASLLDGVSDMLGDPWQQPIADPVMPQAATDSDGHPLPSVRGLDIEKYVSNKSFAITMPSLNVSDLAIEHPTDATTSAGLLAPLQRGVGHLFSFPGDGGSVLVYGHSSNYPWDVSGFAKIFRNINKLKVGDKVYVTYGGKFVVYQVTGHQTVPAGDLASVTASNDGEELILYTCWPPDSTDKRYLVRAVPIGTYSL